MDELWGPVAEYCGLYDISNCGRVRSLGRVVVYYNRLGTLCERFVPGRILRPNTCGPYHSVQLSKDGVATRIEIHRLVARAFVDGETEVLVEVNHKNGIKSDNKAENLEWTNRSGNLRHAHDELGIRFHRGEKNSQSKLTEDNVLAMRNNNMSALEASEMFDVSIHTAKSVLYGQTWKHLL